MRALRESGGLMGVAAYSRGSRLVSREADERMPGALSRIMSSCRATNANPDASLPDVEQGDAEAQDVELPDVYRVDTPPPIETSTYETECSIEVIGGPGNDGLSVACGQEYFGLIGSDFDFYRYRFQTALLEVTHRQ